jgi:hypothetical protein
MFRRILKVMFRRSSDVSDYKVMFGNCEVMFQKSINAKSDGLNSPRNLFVQASGGDANDHRIFIRSVKDRLA